ncbi:bifunctional aminoacyl-tRNA synthetase [Nannizzia gypsea CBS 118893]|uniref:proline--tRNA ligase n=1 Tax=Arthroderma gypseum (strain ATCC MYA-4604 / CBS 118893) TaxID=535722 RepID=E4UVW2_ARTGP|nr:bifunctional aminoacyl-tRNA synthetase [Nannizzia gypsea CBS 118893]EFR02439.1 bifunctional aminoacyl-tRNA synthetase [Nannizzia gypsea CBS 118893]
MSGQESTAPAAATEPTSLPERSANPAGDAGAPQPAEISKNAAKKAAKKEKLAQGKAGKADKGIGHSGTKHVAVKPAKKKGDGPALIGIDVAKEDDFAAWYQQVLLKGEMLDYYDVSGCFVLKPHSFFIWEQIQSWFDAKIKQMNVKNCSFPLFVSEDVLKKEKDHIEGFAAEVAWVTHAGNSALEKKIAIRPTSETVMYPYYAKWIRSHRDLPLKLNQWNSVVRWEFKNPQPFLRTREFLWQEGHTAHLTKEEAHEEVLQILQHYAHVYEELLAVPVIQGQKTDKEKFAGGLYTTTVEGYIPATGRGIQGGTSHGLGQNFSKMFGITVEDPSARPDEKKPPLHVWQNSWGLSTRTIGVMVMIHGDNRGLVLPPRVADIQTVIVPVGLGAKTPDDERAAIMAEIEAIATVLSAAGVRVEVDKRDGYTPGWKFNDWELKGIPLRLEFGPGESAGSFVTTSRRDIAGKEGKSSIAIKDLGTAVPALLETIQADLYSRAKTSFDDNVKKITNWDDFCPALNSKNICMIPHCLTEVCEDQIKEMSARKAEEESGEAQDAKAPSMGAKSLCIPFDQPEGIELGVTKCANPKCEKTAEKWCMFGRKYFYPM